MDSKSIYSFTEEQWRRAESRFRLALWAGGVGTALLQAWAFRHVVNPDGISYLDIARACTRGDWHSLVNGYWSPLYPFLLGITFRVFEPSLYWESTAGHFVNVGNFILAFLCFELFLTTLIRSLPQGKLAAEGREPLPDWALLSLGRAIFVCYTLLFVHVELLDPDLCVAAVVFLAAALLVRIRSGDGGWLLWAAFGAVLGTGYLAKGVMFPLAFVFLGCCFLGTRPFRRAMPGVAVALVVFLLVGGPFLLALSKAKGRLTFGETGKIAYAELVDGVRKPTHWQGGPPGTGVPVHSTRMVLAEPPLFEFAMPIAGTYPPWYDPSYWYEGVVPVFKLRNQLRAIRYTIEEYAAILPYMGGVLVGFLGLVIFAGTQGPVWKNLLDTWPLWTSGAAALVLYGLVFVEARYVEPFLILIWMALFAGLRFPKSAATQAVVRCVTLAVILVCCTGIAWLAGRAAFRALTPQPFVEWEIAQGLKKMGVQPGERVGVIGDALHAYWAHLDGARIVAEIPFEYAPMYWSSNPRVQARVLTLFAGMGARIIVADTQHQGELPDGWKEIGHTGYLVYDLKEVATANGTTEK
jgi:hypothetical protein